MPNVQRIRHDYVSNPDLNNLEETGFQSTQYTNGTPSYIHGISGTGRNLKDIQANFIADTTDRTTINQWKHGHWPSCSVTHLVTNFGDLGYYNDYDIGPYSERFDINGRPHLLSISQGVMWNIIGNPDYILSSWGRRIPNDLHSSLSEQAFNYFSDVFPTKLSFAEFVQGFLELKSLLPELGDSIGKTISGGYLNKQFGWDNLLADLNTLGTICHDVIARMDFFHKTYGIPTRLGFSRQDVYHPDLSGLVYHAGNGNGIWHTRFSLVGYRADFRATAWIMQVLGYVRDLAGFIRTMIGALGLNNPVKAFWNTVPLSFVVDWFFNVSQHLDHLTRLNPAVGWDVTNMTNSVKYSYRWKVEQLKYPLYGTYDVIQTKYFNQSLYERNVGLSFPWELLNPEELSTTQLSLLLAMLHQLS